ncbi:hypothetical protein HIM_09631 [Hirsutella minnesotensis 3608]|uniref:Uncharacterized protein n=1 Tax=Hirsutella minnesotensis 3608 TaxID=1043627 RepID=A0A0F7ZGJ0_9HYPO|nr:hypothetical protein HIM_09631 [Hirsutella minnesotensis 3608]
MNAPTATNQLGPAPNTAGPHRHDVINKLDPTVDSQSGGAQILGPGINSSAQGAAAAAPPPTNQAQVGVGNNYGLQHNSRPANVLDPRVDSSQTRDAVPPGSAAAPGISAPPSINAPQGTYGPHSTRTANTLDPRIDSDLDGRGRVGMQGQPTAAAVHPGGVTQPGPAPTTAGPHRHDIMNKLDPTVDSKAAAPQAQYRTT